MTRESLDIFRVGDISKSPNFYTYLRSTKNFFVIPYLKNLTIVNPQDLSCKSIVTGEKFLVGRKLLFDINKLDSNYTYLGFISYEQVDPDSYKNSIYVKQDPEFDIPQKLLLFDKIFEAIYESRLESLKIELATKSLTYIEIVPNTPVYFKLTDDSPDIWKRFFMLQSKFGTFFLKEFTDDLVTTNNWMIYNDYTIKTCVISDKKESNNEYYIICRIQDEYFRVYGGLTYEDFKHLSKGDKIKIAVRLSKTSDLSHPVYVSKVI